MKTKMRNRPFIASTRSRCGLWLLLFFVSLARVQTGVAAASADPPIGNASGGLLFWTNSFPQHTVSPSQAFTGTADSTIPTEGDYQGAFYGPDVSSQPAPQIQHGLFERRPGFPVDLQAQVVPNKPPPPSPHSELFEPLRSFGPSYVAALSRNDNVAAAKVTAHRVRNLDVIAEAIGAAKTDAKTKDAMRSELMRVRVNPFMMEPKAELSKRKHQLQELVRYLEVGELSNSFEARHLQNAKNSLNQVKLALSSPTVPAEALLPDNIFSDPAVVEVLDRREASRSSELTQETIRQFDIAWILMGPNTEMEQHRKLLAKQHVPTGQLNTQHVIEKVKALTEGSLVATPPNSSLVKKLIFSVLNQDIIDTSAQHRRINKSILDYVIENAITHFPKNFRNDKLSCALKLLELADLQQLLQMQEQVERDLENNLQTVPDDEAPYLRIILFEVRENIAKIKRISTDLSINAPLTQSIADKSKAAALSSIDESLRLGPAIVAELPDVKKNRFYEFEREEIKRPLAFADWKAKKKLELDGLKMQSDKLKRIQEQFKQSTNSHKQLSAKFEVNVDRLLIAIELYRNWFSEDVEILQKEWETIFGKPRGPPNRLISINSSERIEPMRPYFDPMLDKLYHHFFQK